MIYFTQKELAQRWRISAGTLKNWREKGVVPFFQVPHSTRILYPVSEILCIEQSNKKEVAESKPVSRNWRI